MVTITGAEATNLKGVPPSLPIGVFVCITGVSGSGQPTLINDTLVPAIARQLGGKSKIECLYSELSETEHIKYLVSIDQSAIGKTPRSNPATYTGIFTTIRELFSQVPLSRERGYNSGRSSFNVRGGRCETAKVKEAAGLNCTSYLTSSCHVRFAKVSDTVKRH